ncbi:MAG: DHH family phosphoesterase, partial [Natrialbaceae archaeon]
MSRPAQVEVGETVTAAVDAVTDFAVSNPLLAGVVVDVAVATLVGLVLLYRRLTRSPGETLRRVLAEHERVSVLMHPNPDPDAMAAAQGVAELATAVDTEPVLQHSGQIRHQENRAFETVLDLDLDQIETAEEVDADAVVLVDHNEPRGFPGAESITPVAVVDHHPGDGTGTALTDVRPEYGACATIVSEYFEEQGIEPGTPDTEDANGEDSPLPSTVATGLIYGIQSDTNHLTKGCSAAEFDAAGYLYAGIDEEVLDRVANPEVDTEVLEVKARAITARDVRGAFACSDVGTVSNVDAIPQAADELLRLEGVTAVVVLGEADGTVHLSGRSRDDRVHMGKALQATV